MDVIKIGPERAETARFLIRKAFRPLFETYRDAQNPYNKSLERVRQLLERDDAWLLLLNGEAIGFVRIPRPSSTEARVSDLAILSAHQNKGYAQTLLREVKALYPAVKNWSLVTIAEEPKNCHLYEKLGYQRQGIIETIHDGMHLVLYRKNKEAFEA